MIMVFKEIYKMGIIPTMIRRANKLYKLEVPRVAGENPKIIFKFQKFQVLPKRASPLPQILQGGRSHGP